MLLGQTDFLMLRLVGRRMSPEVLTTYGNTGSVTAEVWGPLRADLGHSLWALGLVALGWLLLWGIVRWSWRQNSTPQWSGLWWVALVGGAVYLWSVPFRYEVMRVTMRPPEVVWAQVWWGGEQNPVEADRSDRVVAVRGMLVAAEDVSWQDDAYPLVRALPSGGREGGQPDIIVLVVESLRGATRFRDSWPTGFPVRKGFSPCRRGCCLTPPKRPQRPLRDIILTPCRKG